MATVAEVREDVDAATKRVVDLWTGLLPAARLELRSSSPTLAALVPVLDALARSVEELDRRQREHDAIDRSIAAAVAHFAGV